MGDRKKSKKERSSSKRDEKDKEKDKAKDKDKEKEKEKSKDKRSKSKHVAKSVSRTDSDSDSDSSSSSSSSGSSSSSSQRRSKSIRRKHKEKEKKKKRGKQAKKKSEAVQIPYNFVGMGESVMPSAVMHPSALPGHMPGHWPPPPNSLRPAAPAPPPPVVIKPKVKEVNIFKLLPRLPVGAMTFVRTIHSADLMSRSFYGGLVKNMVGQVEKTVKEENHKKGIELISKCKSELEKIDILDQQDDGPPLSTTALQFGTQHINRSTSESTLPNRYDQLYQLYQNSMRDPLKVCLTK